MQANFGLVVGSSGGNGPIRCHVRPSMCRTGVELRSALAEASVSRYSSISGIQSSNKGVWVCFDHHCVLDQRDLSHRRLCQKRPKYPAKTDFTIRQGCTTNPPSAKSCN